MLTYILCNVGRHVTSTGVETYEKNKFKRINVCGDGQCLFRCAATYSNVELQTCHRNEVQLPVACDLQQAETEMAQRFREAAIQCIQAKKFELQKLETCIPFVLEREVGERFLSVDCRLDQMQKSCEYVGELEILALAFSMKTQICFHKQQQDSTYCLVAKLPIDSVCKCWPQMNVCYRTDTSVQAGHFDLLLDVNTPNINASAECQRATDCDADFMYVVRSSFGIQTEQNLSSARPGDEGVFSTHTSVTDQSQSSTCRPAQPQPQPTQSTTESPNVQHAKGDQLYRGIKLAAADRFAWLENAGKDKHGKRCVRCSVCANALSTSKLLSKSHRIPPIAEGCRHNAKVVIDHALSAIHKASTEAGTDKKLYQQRSTDHPWLAVCSKINQTLYQKLMVFAFDIYNDAKTGTLSAWSWPCRHLARSASASFAGNAETASEFASSFADIQYLNPTMHRELLHSIAEVGRGNLVNELSNALAISLSYDGSVDAYQEDSKYVGVRYVTPEGEMNVKFLGSEEPTERGVLGAVGAIRNVVNNCQWKFDDAVKVISGLTTDGESLNTGSKNGLWAKLQELCSLHVVCFWCACHRSSLALKNLFKTVDEADRVLQSCRNVATFFRTSGIRSLELTRIAESINEKLLRFPEHKEVRMTEFTANLLRVMIRNLPSCLNYWKQRSEDKTETDADRNQMRGFLRTWTNSDHLKLLHVLLDCCEVMERLQKRLQYSFATLQDVAAVKTWAMASLNAMIHSPSVGGHEHCFLSSILTDHDDTEAEDGMWHGFQLTHYRRRQTGRAHLFTSTSSRSFDAVRHEVIMSLINFIDSRLDSGDVMDFLPVLFNPRCWTERASDHDFVEVFGRAEMVNFQKKYVPDLNVSSLVSDFTLIKSSLKNDKLSLESLTTDTACHGERRKGTDVPEQCKLNLLTYALRLNVSTFAVACARMMAVFPHSMYVERLVSAHNLIKSDRRSTMDRATMNDYMFVKESMGPVAKFDPRPAIANWFSLRQRRPKSSENEHKVDKYKDNEFVKQFFY